MKPIETKLVVHVHTGQRLKLALAPDGSLWKAEALRKDGQPNRSYASAGDMVTKDTMCLNPRGWFKGSYALYDASREIKATALRDSIRKYEHLIAEAEVMLLDLYRASL